MTSEGSPKVFVIDDDDGVRAAIQGMLKSVGLASGDFRLSQRISGGQAGGLPKLPYPRRKTSRHQRPRVSATVV